MTMAKMIAEALAASRLTPNENAPAATEASINQKHTQDPTVQIPTPAENLSNCEYACEPAVAEEFDIVSEVRAVAAKVVAAVKEPTLTITRFDGSKTTSGKRHDVSWQKLHEVFADPKEHKSKAAMPLLKFSELTGDSRATGFVPLNMTAVVGDYDGEVVSIDEAAEMLETAGICSILYTTASHSPEAPRWRVVARLEAATSCEGYIPLMDSLNGALGGILAAESWQVTRCYYYGKAKDAEYIVKQVPGESLDFIMDIMGASWVPMGMPDGPSKATTAKAPRATAAEQGFDRQITLDQVTDETVEDVRSALGGLTADDADEYAFWILIGQALKSLAKAVDCA